MYVQLYYNVYIIYVVNAVNRVYVFFKMINYSLNK